MKFIGGPKQTHKLWQDRRPHPCPAPNKRSAEELDDDMSGAISFDEFTRPEEVPLDCPVEYFADSVSAQHHHP